MNAPVISIIVAMSKNRVIGRGGGLPWRLSSDLKTFKRVTMGKPLLMGRKTFESLPGLLPGRPHLVLTRDAAYSAKGAEVFNSLDNMIGRGCELAGLSGSDEVMIIGGGELYRLALPFADRLYVTAVDAQVDGDTLFPDTDANWILQDSQAFEAGPRDDFNFTFNVYERA